MAYSDYIARIKQLCYDVPSATLKISASVADAGNLAAGNLSIVVTSILDFGESSPSQITVVIPEPGSKKVNLTISRVPQAKGYSVYAGALGAEKFITEIPATANSTTTYSLTDTAVGSAAPTTNTGSLFIPVEIYSASLAAIVEEYSQNWPRERDQVYTLGYGTIDSATVTAAGLGYQINDILDVVDGIAVNGQVRVLAVDGLGKVLRVSVENVGIGYSAGLKATVNGNGAGCTVTITVSAKIYTLPTDYVNITSLQYPADEYPPEYAILERDFFIKDGKWCFYTINPTVGTTARFYYKAKHTLSIAADTLPTNHFEGICMLAASRVCDSIAVKYAHQSNKTISQDQTGYKLRADDFKNLSRTYRLEGARILGMSTGVVPYSSDARWDYYENRP